MKRSSLFILCCLTVFFFSCGSNGTSTMKVKGTNGKEYASYQDACRDGDFDAAYQLLSLKKEEIDKFTEENQLEKTDLFGSYDRSNKDKYDAMVKNYEEGMDYVFNAEMLFLASQNTEDASNRILYLLAEYHIPGTPTAPESSYRDDAYDEAKKYITGISRFNNRCNSVLDMAIAQGNEKLAKGVVKIMKQNVDIEADSDLIKSLIISKKGVNNTDIDLAKKKLEEATKSGAFK